MVAISHAPPPSPRAPGRPFRRILGVFGNRMPKGLYARALIIIIAPMVLLLQWVVDLRLPSNAIGRW